MCNDLSEEIEYHIGKKTEELVAHGLSRTEAESTARREFGNLTSIQERSRDAWFGPMADGMLRDIRFAARQLRKNRGFTATAVVTLAIGIGATAAMFSLVNTVLLRPLPFPEANRLVWIKQQDQSLPGIVPESLSYPDYFDWRASNHTLSGMASYNDGTVTLESGSEPRHLDAVVVSSNFFRVLGAAPMLGRDFRADEEKPGNRAVMLSYSLWQSAFGSAPDVAGRTIRMGDHDYIVAGVMPRQFQFPIGNPGPALWISMAENAEGKDAETGQRGFDVLDVVGRLKAGVSVEQAKADLSLIAADIARRYPDNNKHYSSALVEPELKQLTGDIKPALRLLFGAVALLLVIACANVASLLMAQGSRRSAELAVRASIGASRAVIIRQLLVESVVLSLLSGVAGIAFSYGLLRAMMRLIPLNIPRAENVSIDNSVLLFVTVVAVLSGLFFGMLPAWRMSQLKLAQGMREGLRTVAGPREQHRVHNLLVVGQTAISLVLLVASGLLVRSFIRIQNADPGFDPKQVWTARVELSFDKLSNEQRVQFYNALVARLSGMPAVRSASAGWPMPMSNSNASISFNIIGRGIAKQDEPDAAVGLVMPGYFEALRIPLISGRTFTMQDNAKGKPAIIINQAFARKYFQGENPLGKQIRAELGDGVVDHAVREIVGVVGDIRERSLTTVAAPEYYLPFAQAVITNLYIVVRTAGDPALVQGALRAAVRELDPRAPIYQGSSLEAYVSKSVAGPRFEMLLLTGFAGAALLLAAIGLYGLLSYMVAQRSQEIGVRIALGAQRPDMLRMVLSHGLALAFTGLIAGLALSAMTARLMAGMLYGVRPYDALSYTATGGVLLAAALLASAVPAYRAMQVDPVETLRAQ